MPVLCLYTKEVAFRPPQGGVAGSVESKNSTSKLSLRKFYQASQ